MPLRYARSKSSSPQLCICSQYKGVVKSGTGLYCYRGSENVSAKRNVCGGKSRNLSLFVSIYSNKKRLGLQKTKFHKNLLRIVGGVARQRFTHTHNLHNLILIDNVSLWYLILRVTLMIDNIKCYSILLLFCFMS